MWQKLLYWLMMFGASKVENPLLQEINILTGFMATLWADDVWGK